jgi:hypothetical protein
MENAKNTSRVKLGVKLSNMSDSKTETNVSIIPRLFLFKSQFIASNKSAIQTFNNADGDQKYGFKSAKAEIGGLPK